MCKQHLIIKLKKHTNEIKTFSKWAAALRPDFMGPWPANLYLCLNWAPGKAAVRKARFWCQREGRTRPVEAERLLGNSSPASLCSRLPGASLITWDSVSKPAQTSPLWQEPSLGPASAPAHSLTCSFTPSVPTAYSFVANLKAKTEKKPQKPKMSLDPLPLWLRPHRLFSCPYSLCPVTPFPVSPEPRQVCCLPPSLCQSWSRSVVPLSVCDKPRSQASSLTHQ